MLYGPETDELIISDIDIDIEFILWVCVHVCVCGGVDCCGLLLHMSANWREYTINSFLGTVTH